MGDNEITGVIKTLGNSDKIHWQEKSPYGTNSAGPTDIDGNYRANKGERVGSRTQLDLKHGKLPNDGLPNSPETTLTHEMSHQYDYDQGNNKNQEFIPASNKDPKEKRAVRLENKVRKYLKMEKRNTYGGKKIE